MPLNPIFNPDDPVVVIPELAPVKGESGGGVSVFGSSETGIGVWGRSKSNSGVHAESDTGVAIFCQTNSGIAIWGKGDPLAGFAGRFDGHIQVNGHSEHNGTCSFNGDTTTHGTHTVTGDIVLANADCAEEFDVAATGETEPGTVMVLDRQGALQPSQQAYDKKVAGVISGAGDYRPGLILDKKESSAGRMPVALVGKAYCKVDARYAPIEVGDLLTTSDTLGYAMKADDPLKAFGAVIGKALRPLKDGQDLIPILIALQ
jgi:hypothetical protein